MKSLAGKRVMITGAAQGIGRAMALRFAREGAQIIGTDLREDSLPDLAEALRPLGADVFTYRLDVTDQGQVEEVRERVLRDGGPIDVLVNNAGVVFGGALLDVPLEQHLATYRVNTLAVVGVTYAFLPQLIARGEAHVVNIASASGFVALPYGTTYASSKWAVIGFSDSLRLELIETGHRHVGVTTVCPSYIATGMFEGAKSPRFTKFLRPERIAELVVQAVQRRRPMVIAPNVARVAPMMHGLLPTRMIDRIGAFFGANTSMQPWRGHNRS